MVVLQTSWFQISFLLISVLVLVFVYGPASVIGRISSDPNLPSCPSYDPQPYSIHRRRFEAKHHVVNRFVLADIETYIFLRFLSVHFWFLQIYFNVFHKKYTFVVLKFAY